MAKDDPARKDPDVWFEPKRYGVGAGLPVAPQGWALLIGYLVAMVLLVHGSVERHRTLFVVVAIALTAAFLAIAAQHTRGGWGWRWGGDE